MFRSVLLLSALALPTALFTLNPVLAAQDEAPCTSLVVMYCNSCHSSKRICKGLKVKDASSWKKTITTMAEYGDIDQATQQQVLECLSNKKADDPAICPQ